MSKRIDNEKELLSLGIDELRRLYDSVGATFNHLRSKALAMLVAEIAIITFLFASDDTNTFTNVKIIYGLVFLLIGIVCLIGAFAAFIGTLWGVRDWEHPPETSSFKDIKSNFNNSPVELLRTLKDDYVRIIPNCIRAHNSRTKLFQRGVYMLSAGIFIVLMIKYGGGVVNIVVS